MRVITILYVYNQPSDGNQSGHHFHLGVLLRVLEKMK